MHYLSFSYHKTIWNNKIPNTSFVDSVVSILETSSISSPHRDIPHTRAESRLSQSQWILGVLLLATDTVRTAFHSIANALSGVAEPLGCSTNGVTDPFSKGSEAITDTFANGPDRVAHCISQALCDVSQSVGHPTEDTTTVRHSYTLVVCFFLVRLDIF